MNGLVLLDEEQQQSLYNSNSNSARGQPRYAAQRGSLPKTDGSGSPRTDFTSRRPASPRTDFTSRRPASPRTDFTSRRPASPRTDFTSRRPASPRTDFTSRRPASPRTDFTSRRPASPRTDFTSRRPAGSPRTDFTTRPAGSPRTDFTTNQGLPRTNFTTQGSSGKPSMAPTYNSSPRGHGGHHGGLAEHLDGHDSYPILRRDSDMASSNDATDAESANRYAGGSGLKISVRYIMAGVVLGIALGIVLANLKASSIVAQWVSLPGDLFLRGLKCVVVPYVFCAVAVSIGDIVFVGKVSIVGVQTAKIFIIEWICSTVMGVAIALLFRPLFRLHENKTLVPTNAIGFTCANNLGATLLPNNTVACVSNVTTIPQDALFVVEDVNHLLQTSVKSQITALTLSEQLMQMITPFVSPNITQSLANGDTLSVITFAMVLGSIAGRNFFMRTRRTNYLYLTLLQSRNALFLIMEWLIWLSPIAVISIIAGSFATNQESVRQIDTVYVYVLAVFTAAVLQTLVVFPAIVFLMTRCNPYSHMRQMIRAYVFAFACSSSLATAPLTLTCVRKARVCSQSLANFVISIGVTSNVSAIGFYIPIAVAFLAESSGNGDQITVLRIIAIFFLSLLSCAGTPPIPSSGLVTITTVYTTVFGVTHMPVTFPYVVAMDFLLDRISTVCDINDDIMALKVIAENTDETVAQDHLGERY